ncbi:Predicted arabinose efflux permease, MFS family [Mycolicibacterium neoaurum]|uniref:MFS transporter n=1 Tax=Mycolicibacterium neoaurum TaxID=1795 RepID=UPI0006923EDF|nr:MFS transporter [Mycolicibacterium neoaurum]SDD96792.1 Predicted arabinose efflux permease, MFS family [Mycolicibacterium neoaurum]
MTNTTLGGSTVASRVSRKALFASGFAFAVTMMGTTLPTPLYPIYASALTFTALTVTVLFAVYAIGVVTTLLLLGRLSDHIGRKPVLLAAVACAAASAVLFLLPPSLPLLIVARVVSGIGAGLMSGAGTAAIIDLFGPERKGVAGTVAVAVNAGGLALGTLLSGVVADLSAAALSAPYLAHLVLSGVAVLALAHGLPAAPRTRTTSGWRQRPYVPPAIRGAFTRAVLAAGSGFAVTGVLTAVSGLLLAGRLHMHSHSVAGGVVFLAFAGMATGQLWARRMAPGHAQIIGCLGMLVATGLIALALTARSLPALLAAAATVGIGGGMCLLAGLAMTVERIDIAHRGGVSSAYFAGLYTMLALPAIGVGALSRATDLITAGVVFAGLVSVVPAIVVIAELVSVRRGRATEGTVN